MPAQLLIFYLAEQQRHQGVLAYEWLLDVAQRLQLPGGSAFQAIAGFGRHGQRHDAYFFELAGDLPVAVHFVLTVAEAEQLLARIQAEGLDWFYLRLPVQCGLTSAPT